MSREYDEQEIDQFYEAVLTLKTLDECRTFFGDVCTTKEIASIAQRFQVAKMLSEHHTYNEVAKVTGASTATISRVNRSLVSGNGSYELVLGRMNEE